MKGVFRKPVIIYLLENSKEYELDRDFVYCIKAEYPDWVVFINAGFKFKFPTILPQSINMNWIMYAYLREHRYIMSLETGETKVLSSYRCNKILFWSIKSTKGSIVLSSSVFIGVCLYDLLLLPLRIKNLYHERKRKTKGV